MVKGTTKKAKGQPAPTEPTEAKERRGELCWTPSMCQESFWAPIIHGRNWCTHVRYEKTESQTGWITCPKSWGQGSFVFKIISPEAALSLPTPKKDLDQTAGEECFSPAAGTVQLTKGCLHSNHPLTHTKHFSPFLTDAPPGAGGDKPRAHLTGNSSGCVFQETMGPGLEVSFSVCQNSFL